MPLTVADLVARTLRVPLPDGVAPSDPPDPRGLPVARRLDAALLGAGYIADGGVLAAVAACDPFTAEAHARLVLDGARRRLGAHVAHNPYFIDFPHGVPDAAEFWAEQFDRATKASGETTLLDTAVAVDLLALPGYGRYAHSYEEMIARRTALVATISDRLTRLTCGDAFEAEASALAVRLAADPRPLGDDLAVFAAVVAEFPDAVTEPPRVRETRAVVNAARVRSGRAMLGVDRIGDVVRVMAALSGGDVTLEHATRFRSQPRRVRRALLAAVDELIAAGPHAVSGLRRHRGVLARIGEVLHPGEHRERWPRAYWVFQAARGSLDGWRTVEGLAESALAAGDPVGAARVLSTQPGALIRWADRLLRAVQERHGWPAREALDVDGPGADARADVRTVVDLVLEAMPRASSRVLLSLYEHVMSRNVDRHQPDRHGVRVFVGRSGRAWVTDDRRRALPIGAVVSLAAGVADVVSERLPHVGPLVVERDALDVAVALSGKATGSGHGVMPRGSRVPVAPGGGAWVAGDVLRLFVYWRQARTRTDWDLSVEMLDERMRSVGQVSWTRLRGVGAAHSGDIVDAPGPDGATEFLDIRMDELPGDVAWLAPQIHVYSGEVPDEVEESVVGWMVRGREQGGAPFEARTVRTRGALRGSGRVALPFVVRRGLDGRWVVEWLHLYQSGRSWGNRVERGGDGRATLARAVVGRQWLRVRDLVSMYALRGTPVTVVEPGGVLPEVVDAGAVPVLVALEARPGVPEGWRTVAAGEVAGLLPVG